MADLSKLSRLYGGSLTSDAALVLREEQLAHSSARADSPACKRRKLDDPSPEADPSWSDVRFPAHRAVLWPLSEYFQSKIENWTSDSGSAGSNSCEITLLVPPGQLETGKALVFTMYAQLPDTLTQTQLLQLLTLAESYKIDKVISAVVISISGMEPDSLEWETVLAVLQLPGVEPLYQPAKTAAKHRMLQLLGDLELVWALEQPEQRAQLQQSATAVAAQAAATASKDIKLHELLLQLPFEQLLTLLQDPKLRCTEDTLHYTMTRWIKQQSGVPSRQQEQLASLLQLNRCSPSYILFQVVRAESWTSKFLSPAAAAYWTALSISNKHPTDNLHQLAHRLLQLDPHHSSSNRGIQEPSVLSSLKLDWAIPLVEIQTAYAQCLADEVDKPAPILQQSSFFFQGREFRLQLSMLVRSKAHHGGLRGSLLYLQVVANAVHGDARYHCSYKALKTGVNRTPHALALDTNSGGIRCRGIENNGLLLVCDEELVDAVDDLQEPAVVIGPIKDWAAVVAELRRLRIVAANDHIHVTATISNVR